MDDHLPIQSTVSICKPPGLSPSDDYVLCEQSRLSVIIVNSDSVYSYYQKSKFLNFNII